MTQQTLDPPATPAIRSALVRYRVLAWATGVFLVLLTIHVVVQLFQAQGPQTWTEAPGLGAWIPGGDTWIPVTHGYLYLAYVIVAIDLWFRTRLPVPPMVLVVLAGTVPFMSFVAERWVTHRLQPRRSETHQPR